MPLNHTPAEASQDPSPAESFAFVRVVWAAQDDAVLAWPFSSVTMTWDSPVVAEVIRKGTPARRRMLPDSAFTSSRSPRLTCSATVGVA